jgi:hypothetical protein
MDETGSGSHPTSNFDIGNLEPLVSPTAIIHDGQTLGR